MASLFMRFPEGKAKALTLSYDDGVQTDVRLIRILRAHGLKATFNLNSGLYVPEGTVWAPGTIHRRMSKSEIDAAYDGMEVAVHGRTHPFLERLPAALCTQEVLSDRLALEEQFGRIVCGMAYPFGTFSPAVLEVLRACGIRYARTTHSTHAFGLPADWLTLDPTCHHDDPQLFPLLDRFLQEDPAAGCDHGARMFYLWGHSYEFDAHDNWQRIEEFAEKAGGAGDVWYATNGEIREAAAAFDALIFSADGSRVCNPSARTVWFEYDGSLFSAAPGEERSLR